jgi:hypothetical protein
LKGAPEIRIFGLGLPFNFDDEEGVIQEIEVL